MTPEQNLIQQITRVIENNQLDKNILLEELAAQYSELCSEVNVRLLRCAEYLQKGLLSEAVYEARMAPDLLELAALVQFELSRKWRVICDDLELSKAPLLHTEVLDELRSAYGKEKELQPLLREFRSLIYQGLQHQAIAVLRKIRAADPENSSWQANLQTYEEAELPSWLDKAQQALESMDLKELREIYAELTHPQRVVPAPAETLKRLQRALLSEKAADMLLEAENILNRLAENLSAGRIEPLRQLLEQASQMELDDAFYRRPDNWDEQIALGGSWLEKEEKEVRLQADFEQEGKDLWTLLRDGEFSEESLRHAWGHLQSWGRPLPKDLQETVEENLQTLRQKRLQRQRQRKVLALTGSVLIVLVSVLLGYKILQKKQLKAIIGELDSDFKKLAFAEIQLKLENLQRYKPKFYQETEVQSRVRRLESALSEQDERTRLAKKFISGLDDIRRSGYQLGDDEVDAYLAGAEQLLLTDHEKAQITSWKTAWQTWKGGQRRESNAVLQRVSNQFRIARTSLAGGLERDFALEEQKLQELRLLFQSAMPHFNRAENLFKEDFQQCQSQLEDWQRDMQQRQQQKAQEDLLLQQKQQQRANLTRELFLALPDLQQYRRQLEQLREFHDGDTPFEYSVALTNLEQQSRALALQNFNMRGFPCLPQQENDMRIFMGEGGSAVGSVWEADLRRCLAYLDKHQQVLRLVFTLARDQEHMFQVYVIEIRKKGAAEWTRLYVPALPSSREEQDNKGNTYTLYWGNIFHAEADDEAPHESHTSKVFPGGLSTLEYDVKIARKAQDCLSNQGKFLLSFILNARNHSEMDSAILEALQSLRDPGLEMELIPRTWLQKRLLNFLAEHYAEEVPESLEWAAAINKINTDVPWMNAKHPQVLAAAESIENAAAFYPDLTAVLQRLKFNRELLARALSRRVQCVGAIRLDEKGEPAAFLCVPAEGELWVLATPSLHSPAYWQILSQDGKNTLPEILHNTYQGQLIFAPQASVFSQLSIPKNVAGIRKPHSWPVNDNSLGL